MEISIDICIFAGRNNFLTQNNKSMKKIMQWVMAATIICGFNMLTSCTSSEDNPVVPDMNVHIDKARFPDDNFRAYLLEQDYGQDGVITADEIADISSIIVRAMEITSLKGIEYFTALEQLVCDYNELTELDVSHNPELTWLDCSYNQLTSLDVSNCKMLGLLFCYANELTSLDVSNCKMLELLYCYGNELTSLDLTNCTEMKYLDFEENQLTTIDLSKNTELTYLVCDNNLLTELDLTHNQALEDVRCGSNQLTALDVSNNPNLESIICYYNQIASLDVSHNPELTWLDCGPNNFTELDLSKNPKLEYLGIALSGFTRLDVSNNPALENLIVFCNNINGQNMTDLINSMPQTDEAHPRYFYVIKEYRSEEGNVITQSQVAAAKAKGWSVLYLKDKDAEWEDYPGTAD